MLEVTFDFNLKLIYSAYFLDSGSDNYLHVLLFPIYEWLEHFYSRPAPRKHHKHLFRPKHVYFDLIMQ